MVNIRTQSKTSKAMIRSASLLALTCALWASSAHAQTSDADLVTRIDRLEAEIRDLTGSVEQLQYRNQQLEQTIQRLQGTAPASEPSQSAGQYAPPPAPQSSPPSQYPPQSQYPQPAPPYSPPSVGQAPGQASGQASGTVASAVPMAPGDGAHRGDAFDPSLNPNAPGAPRPLGTSTAATEPPPPVSPSGGPRQPGQPLDLSSPSDSGGASGSRGGDLPSPPQANVSATGAAPVQPPTDTPKDEYDLAYGHVQHRNFGLAEETLRDFLRKYPSDKRAPDAQYWLGESLFQDRQYHDAAESFLAVSTKYENTARAPDALLRLGQSLAALGEKEAACASLGEILRKYPRASVSVKQGVDREQKRAHC